MAELKTRPTDVAVETFIGSIADAERQADCRAIAALMSEVTGEEPRMWGASIVGFGRYHYRYASGREGDSLLTGFSPRKPNITLYLFYGADQHTDLLPLLGNPKLGKGCLYLRRLAGVDQDALRELIRRSVEMVRRTYPD
jgi:hypothetical protein